MRDWFDWYIAEVGKAKTWVSYKNRFLCPCCYMPTLEERGGWHICPICFWEDDGQDNDDADTVRGGPNHDYSLSEARANFLSHHTMYRPSDELHFAREMADMDFKKRLYCAYQSAIEQDDHARFQQAVELQEAHYADEEDGAETEANSD